jgi:membrane-bound metal-dependent hydrolase YbcI (DUF457 family)
MNGNCHFVFGGMTCAMLALNLDTVSESLGLNNTPETAALLILGGLIGSILPDIDNPKSYMGKLSVPVSSMIFTVSEAFHHSGANHRGMFHDPIIYILGSILSYLYCPYLLGIFIGCFTHLYLDAFNPAGIPFLSRRIHVGKIASGSTEGILFTWLNVLAVFAIGMDNFIFP